MTVTQLKKIMKERDMTYQALADDIGVSNKSTVHHWFTRRSVPRHWHKVLKEKYVAVKKLMA